VRVISSSENSLQPAQVALGNFDGIHLGHRAVIRALSEPDRLQLGVAAAGIANQSSTDQNGSSEAALSASIPDASVQNASIQNASIPNPATLDLSAPSVPPQTIASHLYTTVVSFNPHPQSYFSGQSRSFLTVLDEKVQVLESLGVEQLVLLPFDAALSSLTPEAFVQQVLVCQLRAQKISVGFNFCFGCKRSGTAEDLKAIAAQFGVPVFIVPPQTLDGEQVSSSEIRQALTAGEVERAGRLLGRPYSLTGEVVRGQQLGRSLGFPTANLKVSNQKFIPRRGVYRVWVEGQIFGQPQLGVMNIGSRPTVAGTNETIEVHLLDWSRDLYGHTVTVRLAQFLRPEQKFDSLDALKAQIQQDCVMARAQAA
jgi:riboflavin kinase / FMN adenylyltransferase